MEHNIDCFGKRATESTEKKDTVTVKNARNTASMHDFFAKALKRMGYTKNEALGLATLGLFETLFTCTFMKAKPFTDRAYAMLSSS
eukprot:5706070-Amphidinium_carterae.1